MTLTLKIFRHWKYLSKITRGLFWEREKLSKMIWETISESSVEYTTVMWMWFVIQIISNSWSSGTLSYCHNISHHLVSWHAQDDAILVMDTWHVSLNSSSTPVFTNINCLSSNLHAYIYLDKIFFPNILVKACPRQSSRHWHDT